MSINRGMDKDVVHMDNGLLVIKENKIVPFAEIWIDLEIVIYSEVRRRKISYNISYMWNLEKIVKSESHSVVSDSLRPHGLYSPWNSLGQNTGVGSLSLLQAIFPTKGSNSGLSHCRQSLHHLSHKGSPKILEWVAYPFSSRSSWPRIKLESPTLQVDSLPTELSGKPEKVIQMDLFAKQKSRQI